MYKILIADDEDIIRRGLASMAAQHGGLEVAALAEDGEIALEQAKEVRPDLMLVDINMPFMDGFEFIQAAKKLLPDAEIIIVTGYDDFAFAQKALQLGVSDYVLKPIMEDPFFAVLDKAVGRLNQKRETGKYLNWLKRQMERNRPVMITDFFQSWLRSGMDELEIEDRMQYLRIRIPSPYCVALLHLRSDPEQEESITDWDGDLLLYGCDNIIHEVFSDYCEVFSFKTEDGSLAVVSEVLTRQQWEDVEKRITSPIEKYLHVKAELVTEQGARITEFPDVVETAVQKRRDHLRYSEIVVRAIEAINRQWGDCEFTLQAAADGLYVTPQYLSRVFHRETGDTFGSYLSKKRIKEALRLLQNQSLKMYEIARQTGYSSQHYFSSAFKRALGISPAEYRKNLLE